MRSTVAFFNCLLFLVPWAAASKSIGEVVDSLFATYDRRIRPNYGGSPVNVEIEVYLSDVYDFDEIKHQVTLSMYFRHKWTDKRLAFDSDLVNGTKIFTMDADEAKKLWTPDTFLFNVRSAVKPDFVKPNEYTRVYNNGTISRSVKATVTVGCVLNLRWFPFDQNVCAFDFESYGSTVDDILYEWAKDAEGKPKIRFSKETTQSVRHEITAYRGKDYKIHMSTGDYSRVGLELSFKRRSFRYLLDVYFPSTAIPIVAFITLCVGPLHFRVLLSTICMGIMVIYAAILMLLTPKVDYKTALDFYVFNSSVTTFNVVLVNFFIYYLLKPKATPSQMRMRQLNGSSEDGKGILSEEDGGDDAATPGTSTAPRFPNKSYELLYKLCEKSYITVPLFFLAFNLIYWPVVLIASSGTPENFIPIEVRTT